jgi:hypothetical protein
LNRPYVWNFLPSKKYTGGILVGVDSNCFDVLAWDIKEFPVSSFMLTGE